MTTPPTITDLDTREHRLREAMAMQELEGNPLTADDLALLAEMDRLGLSDDEQTAYITNAILTDTPLG